MTTPSPAEPDRPDLPLPAPAFPPPDRAAFLLDFDGTLVDIAPTPASVKVEEGLVETLTRIRTLCGGALAIVTGRPIAQIDHFLPHVPTAIAGEHGLTLRRSPDAPTEPMMTTPLPEPWIDRAETLVARFAGCALERKQAGLVLHYRSHPEAGPVFEQEILAWLSGQDRFEIHPSKMAWEIRLAGVHKGKAVEALMQAPPFRGRIPVFVGDDVTDRDGVEAARAMGGQGYLIPDDFPTAHAFRAFLAGYGEQS
ncbi:trehalose-phosphatase [Swaminathania salitolerans]|uniref:Trehalose 6-phosphate phosphatase n=1 Tax=Swaminathania salitolerans TaxID=182838 RepID=A0A511BR20_9PROT|nr:trehalose-phosphatase [Swaminathania salitolerans]GBQ12268.1 trehalose phosphatase [Swaminathania salitolerans LMG 21291]GEL02787.1 trehalose 6-phosphate phosphatase [Swaminathania salitolerans]